MLPILLAAPVLAQAAAHVPFGVGCTERATATFAAFWPDAASAAADLEGQSLRLLPVDAGYRIEWGGATYRVPSSAAIVLPPSDDGQVAIVPSRPLPTPIGAWSTLWVHSNGFVARGPANDGGAWNQPANDYWPSAAFHRAPEPTFWAWHDWNPAEPGGGRIVREEVLLGGEPTLCVTWRDVENFPVGVTNPGTFQFQFGLVTGRVAYVWQHVDTATSSPFGTGHLIGWSPGPSLSRAFVDLPGGLPLVTAPDRHALALSAAPPPRSTAIDGTEVVFTTVHVPPLAVGSTLRLGFTALSSAAVAGVDLAAFGGPGCHAYVGDLGVQLPWSSHGGTATTTFALPPGLPDGLVFCAQSLALVVDDGLAVRTSNAIRSHVAPQ